MLISIVTNALETHTANVKTLIRNCNHKSMLKTEWFGKVCKTELRGKNALRTYQKNKTSTNWDFYDKKRQSLLNKSLIYVRHAFMEVQGNVFNLWIVIKNSEV